MFSYSQIGITIGAFLLVIGLITYHYTKVSTLEYVVKRTQKELLQKHKELATERLQSNLYKSSLDKQSASIEALRVNYDARIKAIKEAKPKVKYRVIYRDVIKEVNTTKKESTCEEIRKVLRNVSNTDLNNI